MYAAYIVLIPAPILYIFCKGASSLEKRGLSWKGSF